jgi:hypothetical protein
MPTPTHDVAVVTVETAPALTGPWTAVPGLLFQGGKEGVGQRIGSAAFREELGEQRRPDDPATLIPQALFSSRAGHLVRVSTGGTPFWSGILRRPRLALRGQGLVTLTYEAYGIAYLLMCRTVMRGYTVDYSGNGVLNNRVPVFNGVVNGDRAVALETINGQTNTPIHDINQGADTARIAWTANQALEYLFAADPELAGKVAISDPLNLLSYTLPKYDAFGKTFFDVLMDLASPWRGATFSITLVAGIITVTVQSITATAITLGAKTIPANPNQFSIAQATGINDVEIYDDDDQCAEDTEAQGDFPRAIVTLSAVGTAGSDWVPVTGSLIKGWTEAQQTAHEAWWTNRGGSDSRPTASGKAWRRFIIDPQWDGTTTNGVPGTSDKLATNTTNLATGARGYDAALRHQASDYTTEGSLPIFQGFTTSGAGKQDIVVVRIKGSSAKDISDEVRVSIENSPPAVEIDDKHQGKLLKAWLRDGYTIHVTCCLRETEPLRALKSLAPGSWPSSPRRSRLVKVDAHRDYLLAGAVTGVGAGGAITYQASPLVVVDQTDAVTSAALRTAAFFGQVSRVATWRLAGQLDVNVARSPGTMLADWDDGANTIPVDGTLVQRTWARVDRDGVAAWDTLYETERIIPSPGAQV